MNRFSLALAGLIALASLAVLSPAFATGDGPDSGYGNIVPSGSSPAQVQAVNDELALGFPGTGGFPGLGYGNIVDNAAQADAIQAGVSGAWAGTGGLPGAGYN